QALGECANSGRPGNAIVTSATNVIQQLRAASEWLGRFDMQAFSQFMALARRGTSGAPGMPIPNGSNSAVLSMIQNSIRGLASDLSRAHGKLQDAVKKQGSALDACITGKH